MGNCYPPAIDNALKIWYNNTLEFHKRNWMNNKSPRVRHEEGKQFYAPDKKREKNLFDGLITEYRYDEAIKVL